MSTFDTLTAINKSLADQELALRTRDAMKAFAEQQLGTPQARGKLGRVVSVSPTDLKAKVWYPGDDEPVEVHLLSTDMPINADVNAPTVPSTSNRGAGARVWVEDINGKSYITAVLNGGVMVNASSHHESRDYAPNPLYGASGQAYSIQTGAQFSVIVPMPPPDQCIGFGPFDGPIGGAFHEITVHDQIFGGSKTYQFGGLASFAAAFTPDAWYKLVPRYTNVPLDFFGIKGDFDLEIGNAPFVSRWDGLTYYQMALRIRRKNDNDPGSYGQQDGYRVVLRGHHGITALQEKYTFFLYTTWVDALSAEPTINYGNDFNNGFGIPCTGPYDAPGIDWPRRAQTLLTGPTGQTSWDGTNFKFTGDFLIVGGGAHPHTSIAGTTTITMPPNGTLMTVIGSNTATSQAVTASGIQLAVGQALYYNMKLGGSAATDNARWYIVDKTQSAMVPSHWILILQNAHASIMPMLGTGVYCDSGDTTVGPAANWGVTAGYITVRRDGKMVLANWDVIRTGANLAANAGSIMFQVPALFRPNGPWSFEVGGNISTGTAARAHMVAAGDMTLQNHAGINTNQRSAGSAVWMVP